LKSSVPDLRLRRANLRPERSDGEFVLYWMTAARRTRANFSLQRAIDWCEFLRKPLLVFEPIGCRGRWDCDRFHAFVLQGMRDQQARLKDAGAGYLPYVERTPGAAGDVFHELVRRACVVIADDFPCHFLPQMLEAGAARCPVRMEAVDGNGLWPMRGTDVIFPTAHAFRRFLQKNLRPHLGELPQPDPFLDRHVPRFAESLWPAAIRELPAINDRLLSGDAAALAEIPIDHSVGPAAYRGGETAGRKLLRTFLESRLDRYAEHRNDPDQDAASGLSPYLHFGQIGAHEIFAAIIKRESWFPERLAEKTSGSREGWWMMSPEAESFLDELITWRELGFNLCSHRSDYDQYGSLPEWARRTLEDHARDPRPWRYSAAELEGAETHDELWNAAQRQLVREGRMHNYLRMLWGKKVLEWSASPVEAVETLIHLNNKYAVDGRNPNSYSGIFWVFGRYDRAWGPERPIFGKIRYMSSENTARKLRVKDYLERYSP
jgi:deoxyribodipyrimidine photo-lyase